MGKNSNKANRTPAQKARAASIANKQKLAAERNAAKKAARKKASIPVAQASKDAAQVSRVAGMVVEGEERPNTNWVRPEPKPANTEPEEEPKPHRALSVQFSNVKPSE